MLIRMMMLSTANLETCAKSTIIPSLFISLTTLSPNSESP